MTLLIGVEAATVVLALLVAATVAAAGFRERLRRNRHSGIRERGGLW